MLGWHKFWVTVQMCHNPLKKTKTTCVISNSKDGHCLRGLQWSHGISGPQHGMRARHASMACEHVASTACERVCCVRCVRNTSKHVVNVVVLRRYDVATGPQHGMQARYTSMACEHSMQARRVCCIQCVCNTSKHFANVVTSSMSSTLRRPAVLLNYTCMHT